MEHIVLETERLYLRQLTEDDYEALCGIFQDELTVRAAYDTPFSDEEVRAMLDRQLARYEKYGFGPCAVILKETGQIIGQCGLSIQQWIDREVLELGYQFRRDHWHHGYATEAARAWKEYAFTVLRADEVCSIIRETNTASQQVAIRNGMVKKDRWVKPYRGIDLVCDRFVAVREMKE